jgi:hypothetical protein
MSMAAPQLQSESGAQTVQRALVKSGTVDGSGVGVLMLNE